jgi:hypothetical protein
MEHYVGQAGMVYEIRIFHGGGKEAAMQKTRAQGISRPGQPMRARHHCLRESSDPRPGRGFALPCSARNDKHGSDQPRGRHGIR